MEIQKNNDLELENNIENVNNQKSFLETTLGKTINTAIDIGIRALLTDFIDEQVINIKDNLFNHGLKEGISKTVDDAIDLGKSAIGIITGNFENINQMQEAVKTGGVIDGISNVLDLVVNKVEKQGIINNNVANTIKQGKNIILNNIESNIEKTFTDQIKSLEDKLSEFVKEEKEIFSFDYKEIINDFLKLKNPTKEIMSKIIDRIEIHEDKKVAIYYRIKAFEKLK